MPDFLIIGAMKSGTTSLYNYLVQHPRILPGARKELHFFNEDVRYAKGLDWYRRQFPWKKTFRRLGGRITGEATPAYLFHPLVPGRVFEACPDVKLVAILRDPVERAYSHYWHAVRAGYETLSFEEALKAEPERTAADEKGVYGRNYLWHSYQARGIYLEQIKKWRFFYPKERMLVLMFEDLIKDGEEVTGRVIKFLGLKPFKINTDKIHNSGDASPPMTPETKKHLNRYFRPHNIQLSEYLGLKLPWSGLQ